MFSLCHLDDLELSTRQNSVLYLSFLPRIYGTSCFKPSPTEISLMNEFSPECYSPLGVFRELLLTSSLKSPCSIALSTPLTELSDVSLTQYLSILMLTIALEGYFFFLAFSLNKTPLKKLLLQGTSSVVLCNGISHPFVYFIFPAIGVTSSLSYLQVLISAEIFAPLIEALVLMKIWKIPGRIVWPCLITANLISWWVGIYLI